FTTATTGIFNSTNMQRLVMTGGATAFTDVTVDDLINMEDEVYNSALMNGMYLGHRSIINIIKKLKGTDGQYLWAPAQGPEPSTINGYPVMKGEILPARSNSAISTGFVAFGDPTMAAIVGERIGRTISTSDQYRFNYDQVAIRMTERFAFATNSNLGKALCVLVTAAS
ncbi:MAG: phage major capsid protein, partial [Chloroflexia bacterium]|nr:phage major capsid protein [Chloroflexia bacterium]